MAGVEQITGSTVTIRVIAKTEPNEQWGVQRAIRERVKVAFDAAGVRAPVVYPPAGGPASGTGTDQRHRLTAPSPPHRFRRPARLPPPGPVSSRRKPA